MDTVPPASSTKVFCSWQDMHTKHGDVLKPISSTCFFALLRTAVSCQWKEENGYNRACILGVLFCNSVVSSNSCNQLLQLGKTGDSSHLFSKEAVGKHIPLPSEPNIKYP